MFVVMAATIVAFSSRTRTGTTAPWITSPFVGVTICTFAGLLGRAVGGPDEPPEADEHAPQSRPTTSQRATDRRSSPRRIGPHLRGAVGAEPEQRSEEHTSELQSHSDLVCRLLLEKKKKEKNV